MTYEATLDGVKNYSNMPFDQPHPVGTHYKHETKFTVPFLNYIEAWGLSLENILQNFVDQITDQGHKVSNYQIYTPDDYTLVVEYDASSPPVLIGVGIILGIIAIIAYFIDHITTTVVEPIKAALGPTGTGLLLVGLILIGLFLVFTVVLPAARS